MVYRIIRKAEVTEPEQIFKDASLIVESNNLLIRVQKR